MLIQSTKCCQAEAAMQDLGIKYSVERVALSSIDKKDNCYQPRRSISLDTSLAGEYSAAMKRGDVFPMVVVHKKQPGHKYKVVCGRHRIHAMELAFDGKECEVDVMSINVDCDEEAVYFLATNENTRNGFRQSSSEVAIAAAEVLMKTPLPPNTIQHKSTVMRSIALKAGCTDRAVTSEYFCRLATRDFTKAGLDAPVHKNVLENAWRLRSSAHWPSVMRVISQYKDVPKLSEILRRVRTEKILANEVAGEIASRCEEIAASQGKAAYKRALRDPVVSLIEYLDLARQEFETLPPRESIVDEKVDDIEAVVHMIRKAFRDWSRL
jgi:hypothetical protein